LSIGGWGRHVFPDWRWVPLRSEQVKSGLQAFWVRLFRPQSATQVPCQVSYLHAGKVGACAAHRASTSAIVDDRGVLEPLWITESMQD